MPVAPFPFPVLWLVKVFLLPCHCARERNIMMPGSKGQKAVHACMIRLLNLGPAKHEEGVICVANQRIPNVCRIAGAACCGAIRNEIFRWHQLGAKDLLPPTSSQYRNQSMEDET